MVGYRKSDCGCFSSVAEKLSERGLLLTVKQSLNSFAMAVEIRQVPLIVDISFTCVSFDFMLKKELMSFHCSAILPASLILIS